MVTAGRMSMDQQVRTAVGMQWLLCDGDESLGFELIFSIPVGGVPCSYSREGGLCFSLGLSSNDGVWLSCFP